MGLPQYIGAIPYDFWLMGLPGILCGSIMGPTINQKIGSRNVMILFCIMLTTEVLKNGITLYNHWPSDDGSVMAAMDCVPQVRPPWLHISLAPRPRLARPSRCP